MLEFISAKNPRVRIILDDDGMEHIIRHFKGGIPGSKFTVDSPQHLLQMIVDSFPDSIQNAKRGKDDCKIVSVSFPFEIGNCNVVAIEDLTDEEKSSVHIIWRDDVVTRFVYSKRAFPTKECQMILHPNNHVVTVYPGELAPPLPESLDEHDDYWDNHVFIEPL